MEIVESVKLDEIEVTKTQTREELRKGAIAEYADLIKSGRELEPALVIKDGEVLYLAAGFHRREAYRLAGRDSMPCIIRPGTRWDAIVAGLADNQKHLGERLTNADKRRGAAMILRERYRTPDCKVAALVGCSDKTVASVRAELEASSEIPRNVVRMGSDGRRFSVPSKALEGWPGRTNEDRCQCGGVWVSDEGGDRSCKNCGLLYPWDEFPLPQLLDGHRYGTSGVSDDFGVLDPIPDVRGGFYLSHIRAKADGWEVMFTMRGVRADPAQIIYSFRLMGFVPAAPWVAEPVADPRRPEYIPAEKERWEIQKANVRYWDTHGKWPWADQSASVAA